MNKIYFQVKENHYCPTIKIICNGETIGYIGFGLCSGVSNFPAIGYSLKSNFRRRNIMSRALTILINFTTHEGLHAVVDRDNIASQKTLLKVGFVCIRDVPHAHLVFEYKKLIQLKAS